MREILRTTDPTAVAFSTALLRGEGIDCFVLDVHMSILEGSIGLFPRRLMVADRDAFRARAVLRQRPPLEVKDLAIGGQDLKALGLKPGPRFGEILRELLERVTDDPELNTREALLELVRREYLH